MNRLKILHCFYSSSPKASETTPELERSSKNSPATNAENSENPLTGASITTFTNTEITEIGSSPAVSNECLDFNISTFSSNSTDNETTYECETDNDNIQENLDQKTVSTSSHSDDSTISSTTESTSSNNNLKDDKISDISPVTNPVTSENPVSAHVTKDIRKQNTLFETTKNGRANFLKESTTPQSTPENKNIDLKTKFSTLSSTVTKKQTIDMNTNTYVTPHTPSVISKIPTTSTNSHKMSTTPGNKNIGSKSRFTTLSSTVMEKASTFEKSSTGVSPHILATTSKIPFTSKDKKTKTTFIGTTKEQTEANSYKEFFTLCTISKQNIICSDTKLPTTTSTITKKETTNGDSNTEATTLNDTNTVPNINSKVTNSLTSKTSIITSEETSDENSQTKSTLLDDTSSKSTISNVSSHTKSTITDTDKERKKTDNASTNTETTTLKTADTSSDRTSTTAANTITSEETSDADSNTKSTLLDDASSESTISNDNSHAKSTIIDPDSERIKTDNKGRNTETTTLNNEKITNETADIRSDETSATTASIIISEETVNSNTESTALGSTSENIAEDISSNAQSMATDSENISTEITETDTTLKATTLERKVTKRPKKKKCKSRFEHNIRWPGVDAGRKSFGQCARGWYGK